MAGPPADTFEPYGDLKNIKRKNKKGAVVPGVSTFRVLCNIGHKLSSIYAWYILIFLVNVHKNNFNWYVFKDRISG